ncbi:MAG: hypothetical protein WD669_08680 [Pirellulales bacterium]
MVSSQQPMVKFACAACRAQYEVPESMAGKRGKCAKCGADMQVPAVKSAARKADQRSPQYVPVECRVCQTLFYGTLEQVGHKMKCPDCGALTVLPPPPPPAAKKMPAAMEGPQYEVWAVDAAPLPSELATAQPKYVAVSCTHCDTLMHAALDHVGKTIKCPDCGAKHVVPPPREPEPSFQLSPGNELQVDTSEALAPRPVFLPPVRRMLYEEEEEAERARATAKAQASGKRQRDVIDDRGRPLLPPFPLVTGILPFVFSEGVLVHWVILSLGYMLSGYLLLTGIEYMALGGIVLRSVLAMLIAGIITWLLCTVVAASCLKAIVTESSFGSDTVTNWNTTDVTDWFPAFGYFILTMFAANLPGAIVAGLVSDNPVVRLIILLAGLELLFPIVLLSQLHLNSVLGFVSGSVLASLGRCLGSWLLFYLETTILWVACFAVEMIASRWIHPLWVTPLYVAAFFVYTRLLGRLGWRLADAAPAI